MNNKIFIEKVADINIKSSFTTNSIQAEIMNQILKVFPMIKDLSYALEVKNKDMDTGNLIANLGVKIPTKNNPNGAIKINLPIFINNYKLKPIDTIVMNGVAFPLNDNLVKELLNEPDNFRLPTQKEMKETRILSKMAQDEDVFIDSLKAFYDRTNDDIEKVNAALLVKDIEQLKKTKEASDEFIEPVTDCVITKNKNKFDVFYIKLAMDGISFEKETIDARSAKFVMETLGYNTNYIKLAEDVNSGKSKYLKSPVATDADNYQSVPYDPTKIDKIQIVEDAKNGPSKILNTNGKEMEGIIYDLMDFRNVMNVIPSGKLFLDYSKNYIIAPNFQGSVSDNTKSLSEDSLDSNCEGVFLDDINDKAYGPIKITSFYSDGDDSNIKAKIRNKEFTLQKESGLKQPVINGEQILIPKNLKWIKFGVAMKQFENREDYIQSKIAESSFVVTKDQAKAGYSVTRLKKMATEHANLYIPSEQHLSLFLNRINLAVPDMDKVAEGINDGKKLTFTTSFPIKLFLTKKANTAKPTKIVNKGLPTSVSSHIQSLVKNASSDIVSIFSPIFSATKSDMETLQVLDNMDVFLKNMCGDDISNVIIKEGSTFDSLDTIFSLNMVNDLNSAVFLESIDKLKSTLSFLAALRVYVRYGWPGVSEIDITHAVDALSNIIKSLELLKTQKLLEQEQDLKL